MTYTPETAAGDPAEAARRPRRPSPGAPRTRAETGKVAEAMNDHSASGRNPQPGRAARERPASDTAAGELTPDRSSTVRDAAASAEHNPGGQHSGGPLSVGQVRELLDGGVAEPLLADDFPVPVRLDGHWWHLPDDSTTPPPTPGAQDTAGHYRRSPPQLAAQLDQHARRLAATARRPTQEPMVQPP